MSKFSLIIPCYNEEAVIEKTYEETVKALNDLEEDYEIIFVNDGSKDATIEILKKIVVNDKKVKIIDFSRNFGQQAALVAGLDNCDGDFIGFMDADLQDPPTLFKEMIDKIKNEGYDVVYGTRKERDGETKFKKLSSMYYYKVLGMISDTEIPPDTSDFRVMTKQVADEVRKLKEKNRYLRGLVSWVGFKQGPVYFDRPARQAGETKYSLVKMILLALDGIFSFSNVLAKLPALLAILLFVINIPLLFLSLFSSTLLSTSNRLFSLTTSCFILLSIWIVAEYAYRILSEVRDRPLYIIKEKINFK